MKDFLDRLVERRIWRVLVAYPSVTFIWLQAVEFFINNYDLDSRLLTASLIGAVLLFPAAILWNWRHGEAGAQEFSRAEIGSYSFVVAAAAVACVWYWNTTPAGMAPASEYLAPARTLAVMPFENSGGDADVQFLCDGIAESLINWLATMPDVKVISKSAAFRFRDDIQDTAKLAEVLGVDGIIRGRLEKVSGEIVVSTSFVDVRDDRQIWGERLTRPMKELIDLERSIVESIKTGLGLQATVSKTNSSASQGTDDSAAYEHYLRGHFLIQSTNPESIQEGVEELRESIRIDPRFARPYADIADALSQMISYGSGDHDGASLEEARAAAYTAVALAPELAEAHTALATIQQYFLFDWAAAEASYEAAIALNPKISVPYHRYTDFLVLTSRADRAQEVAAHALALDGFDSSSLHAVGLAALFAGDFAASVKAFGDWNRFHPGSRWSYVKHAVALSLDGQCDAALEQGEKAEELMNNHPSTLPDSWLAWSYKVCGHDDKYAQSKARIEATHDANPEIIDGGLAYLYALEGDSESLVELVSRVVETKDPLTPFIGIFQADHVGWSVSAALSEDQRYQAILAELQFPGAD